MTKRYTVLKENTVSSFSQSSHLVPTKGLVLLVLVQGLAFCVAWDCLAEVGRDYRSVLILNERHVICIGRYSALEGPLAMVPEARLEQTKRTLALPALFATADTPVAPAFEQNMETPSPCNPRGPLDSSLHFKPESALKRRTTSGSLPVEHASQHVPRIGCRRCRSPWFLPMNNLL
jgi:hypothetical protein